MAFALAPEPPVADWLGEIDEWIRNSAGFFVGRPVVLDLAAVSLSGAGIAHLISELAARDIRVMGIENADAAALGPGLPPVLKGGRAATMPEATAATPATAAESKEVHSLVLEVPVRSGQSVVFPTCDVTVLGSIASGAEVVAGGSVHVYGTLRAHPLPQARGRAFGYRRLLPGCRRHLRRAARPARAGLARRYDGERCGDRMKQHEKGEIWRRFWS
jgi:septum site-determining protein MinC